jgi:hypothetical protein
MEIELGIKSDSKQQKRGANTCFYVHHHFRCKKIIVKKMSMLQLTWAMSSKWKIFFLFTSSSSHKKLSGSSGGNEAMKLLIKKKLTQNSTSSTHPIDNSRNKKGEEGEEVIFIHRFTIHFSFASFCRCSFHNFLIKLNSYSLNFCVWHLTEFFSQPRFN